MTSGSSLVSLKEEDEAPGWVTTMGPVWGVRANQARITGRHRQLIHRGAGAPSQPTEPLHSRDVPHAFEWTLCFHLGKTPQFQETTQQFLPHLPPSLGNGKAGEFLCLGDL